jgi:hypothetical protein
MVNHINIQHPDKNGVDSSLYRDRLAIEKLKIELSQLQLWHSTVCSNLESIFDRSRVGEKSELHYPDGSVIVIAPLTKDPTP